MSGAQAKKAGQKIEQEAYKLLCPPQATDLGSYSPELRQFLANLDTSAGAAGTELAPEFREERDDLAQLIRENWASIFTIKKAMEEAIAQKQAHICEIQGRALEEKRAMTILEIRACEALRKECAELKTKFLEETGQNRDYYYALRAYELKILGEQVRTERIAQVPYVVETIKDIVEQLHLRETVFLYGHTGAGKTEVARRAARKFSGKDPILVRCYPNMSQEELFGHLTLTATGLQRAADVVGVIEGEIKIWEGKGENKNANEKEKKNAAQLITGRVLQENRATVVEYMLGAQYKAMKEGRVIIYDEANAMPADLRRKLNDLKTKRVGERVLIQEDGGEEFLVAQGYGEIETANTGKRYGEGIGGGRFAYTPDEEDRRQAKIEYDYLPQAVKGSIEQVSDARHKQLFMIAVASCIDEHGNIAAPKDSLEKLWILSQYAALSQQAFSGTLASENQFRKGGVTVPVLTDVMISPRGLASILNAWKRDAYQYELDYYIARNILHRASDPTQRAFLYQLGQTCGLFGSQGWVDNNTLLPSGKITSYSVDIPQNKAGPTDFISFTKIVESIWGEAPARSMWKASDPKPGEALSEAERVAFMQGLNDLAGEIETFTRQLNISDVSAASGTDTSRPRKKPLGAKKQAPRSAKPKP